MKKIRSEGGGKRSPRRPSPHRIRPWYRQNIGNFVSRFFLFFFRRVFKTVLSIFRFLSFRCRLRGREAGDRQEETETEKEGQKEQAVQGEGLPEAEEVHVAAAVGVQAQVLHARAADAGRTGADRGHDRFRRFLFRAVRRRPGPQGTPLTTAGRARRGTTRRRRFSARARR